MNAITQLELPGLSPEVEARCDERLKVARTHMAAGCWHWIEAGKQFAANHSELKGHFRPWCEQRNVAPSTAYALIAIAEQFGECLVTRHSEPVQIDFDALRLLASRSVDDDTRREAVERAEAGEHITKQEAEEMVAAAKAEKQRELENKMREGLEAYQEEEAKRAKAAIKDATTKLRGDKKALANKLKEIRDERKAVAEDPEKIAAFMARAIGVPQLANKHYQLLAQILDRGIAIGNKTYAPESPEKIKETENNLKLAATVTEAVQALAAAPPAEALLAACYPVQRALMREKLDGISAWIKQCRAALATYADERV